ncbi:hypothetical protein [Gordonia sp. N1V]|uniref:hypothetical protein n=1 Tax=Gordonia sp. N1V TaxID=3034163 RepID=UPI0023E1A13B|nr:hypothetical protein [Gordonia sp. N1V]MDF3285004.1 hypothetical protein [Gordonia sp. N1V]
MRKTPAAHTTTDADGNARHETPWFDPATGTPTASPFGYDVQGCAPTPATTPSEAEQLPKGLRLNVYRAADGVDCTLDGVTSRYTHLTLIGYQTDTDIAVTDESAALDVLPELSLRRLPRTSRVFAASADAPAVVLVVRTHHGLSAGRQRYAYLAPLDALTSRKWVMFGGNYAATTDSRLSELLTALTGNRHSVLAVHDRIENYPT